MCYINNHSVLYGYCVVNFMTKCEEIACQLLKKIKSGELSGRLPAEQELAKQCNVSPVTAAKALNLLRDQGVVKRISGRGTFVVKPEKKILRVMSNGYFAEKLFPLLAPSFPDVEIEKVRTMDAADAVVLPTTIPFFPGEYFMPWPQERIDRLKAEGKLFPQIFEFHNVRGAVWGLPYLFSPDILFYNKKLMRQLEPDFEPYKLTFESLLKLQKKLPENIRFCAGGFSQLLLSLVYNLAGNGIANPQVFRSAVESFSQLDVEKGYASFLEGKALFCAGYRSKTRHFNGDFDIAPMPLFNGKRLCHAASEVFMIRNTTRHAELLFDMAEALFRPELQRIIGSLKMGIPANAAVAASTLDSSQMRDDIFLNEIKNIDYAHRHMADSVSLCFSSALKRLVCDDITPDELLTEVEESYRFEEKRRKAMSVFMVNSAAVDF